MNRIILATVLLVAGWHLGAPAKPLAEQVFYLPYYDHWRDALNSIQSSFSSKYAGKYTFRQLKFERSLALGFRQPTIIEMRATIDDDFGVDLKASINSYLMACGPNAHIELPVNAYSESDIRELISHASKQKSVYQGPYCTRIIGGKILIFYTKGIDENSSGNQD